MKQASHTLDIETHGVGLSEITGEVTSWVKGKGFDEGLLTLFLRHTSASLLIQENADPDVLRDLQTFFEKLSPWDPSLYRHRTEGPDDMPAHIRASLTQTSLSVPLSAGHLALGTWQGLYLFEHRSHQQIRHLALHLLGT